MDDRDTLIHSSDDHDILEFAKMSLKTNKETLRQSAMTKTLPKPEEKQRYNPDGITLWINLPLDRAQTLMTNRHRGCSANTV